MAQEGVIHREEFLGGGGVIWPGNFYGQTKVKRCIFTSFGSNILTTYNKFQCQGTHILDYSSVNFWNLHSFSLHGYFLQKSRSCRFRWLVKQNWDD